MLPADRPASAPRLAPADLRGAAAAAPPVRRRRRSRRRGRAADRGRARRGASRPCWTPPSGSTASARPSLRVPAADARRGAGRARPGGARRRWRPRSRRARLGARGAAARPTSSPRSRRAARSPSGGCRSRRVGLYVPGGLALYPSSVVMNVVPAQVAGRRVASPSPRRRRREHGGCRTRRPRRVRAARRRRGLRGRRRAGRSRCSRYGATDPTARDSSRSTWSPARATSTSPRPSGCCAASSPSTPRPGPTEIAVLADDTADPVHVAADLISQAEHDPLAASVLITTSRRARRRRRCRAGAPGRRRPSTPSGSATALAGPQSGDRAGRRPRRRRRGRRRLRRRAPGDPDRGRRARWRARIRNAGAVFVGPYSPVSLGDYCAGLQPRAADRRLRAVLRGPVGPHVPAGDPRRRVLRGGPGRGRRRTSPRSPPPRTCPRTARRSPRGSRDRDAVAA